MGKQFTTDLRFPLGGLHKAFAYQGQPPYTSPDCLNVRPVEGIDGRLRGGSRPGLDLAYTEELGGGNPVRLISQVRAAFTDGLRSWWDTFEGSTLAAHWVQASWLTSKPGIATSMSAVFSMTVQEAGVVRTDLDPFDTTQAYEVSILIEPYGAAHNGTYSVFLRMHDTTPVVTTDGVLVEFTITGSTGVYTGNLKSYASSVETVYAMTGGTDGYAAAGWLRILVVANTISVYWRGTLLKSQAVSAHTGTRFGFGMNTTVAGGTCLVNAFRIQYRTGQTEQRLRDRLVASANGEFWRSTYDGTLEKLTTNLTLNSDRRLNAADRVQKLYIADYGEPKVYGSDGARGTANNKLDAASVSDWSTLTIDTDDDVVVISNATGDIVDGTYAISAVAAGEITLGSNFATGAAGTCSYRIERGPKVYDPVADTLALYTATTAGQVPTGCPLVCRWRDRIVLAGHVANPHQWYMSRSGDQLDWDYSLDVEDVTRPVSGQNSDAGTPGEPLTALMPFNDDYLLMGCKSSLWLLRGDPATMVASLDRLHDRVGVIGANAWCKGGVGEIYFLSTYGVFVCRPGDRPYPENISREKLPNDLTNLDDTLQIEMAFDPRNKGLHIYIVGTTATGRTHWFYSFDTDSWWPVSVPDAYEPTALFGTDVNSKPVVLLGGRDGYIRQFDYAHSTDQGTAITNYVVYGPVRLGRDHFRTGVIRELAATLGKNSGDVSWQVMTGDAAESCLDATVVASGTWAGGRNHNVRPHRRGVACALKLSGSGTEHWTIEIIGIRIEQTGKFSLD